MEKSSVRLAGSEIHGFHTWEDLEVEKMMEEATSRWLRPNEIHAILYNHNLFTILVKPVNLPNGGTVVLFDRKMLRNFRRDGHNWKKKKDGKTVKEAHEHLKVGNEERIHVYYAHGLDNTGFVRRCYWLLDKKYEHIVLVHYRETLESAIQVQGSPAIQVQGSPVAPVPTNSGSAYSDTSTPTTRILPKEIDHQANHQVYSGSGTSPVSNLIQVDDSTTVNIHAKKLYEINTLEWDDLLGLSDPNDPNDCTPEKGAEPWNQYKINDPKSNTSLLPSNNIHGGISSFGHLTNEIARNASTNVTLPTSGNFQNMGAQTHFELVKTGTDGSLGMVKDGLQTQDSFGRWMNYIMADSPDSLDGLPVESSSSTVHGSSLSAGTDQHQSSNQQQIFSITDISPGWAFSTEETKVIVIGYFHGGQSQLAGSNLVIVLGDQCLPAEMVQNGVFRCMALPHSPGLVNLYLSLDGHTPISQVMSFEYRSPSTVNVGVSPKEKSDWEEFQVELRLAHLLFSDTNSLAILSSKVSPYHVKEAKKFAQATSSIVQDWDYFIESIGKNEISYPQAQRNLFLITLKNKLQEWLLERVIEGSKTNARDRQGQGIIHLCAILGYTWAIRPYSRSGLSLDFRDDHGWTALHWAAHYGREKMAATLLTAGANPSLVSDPSTEFPGGCTCADLASKSGYDGLAAYLAEKGLTEHFNRMSLSGNISGSLQKNTTDYEYYGNLNEEEICQKDSLTAYRTAADAAARIQTAFRENSLKLRKKAAQLANPEVEARNIVSALKIQHAFRDYKSRKRMQAAARIQYTFRTWKIRNEFLNMRRQAIRIQAIFRGHQVRKEYRKIIWSVGVLEKAILRWRRMRKGFRGLQVEPTMVDVVDPKEENTAEEDFFVISRKQAEERVERSVVRVQALFRSYKAQQEYRRMKLAFDQAQMDDLFET